MRSFVLLFAWCLLALTVAAQKKDTLYLQEIIVYGLPVTGYSTGSKVEKITTTDEVKTLADGLSGEASLYLKNYGNQQLSTIAFRGTTASQTAVLWNGININSPTLGQTDFSLIPVFLFDEVTLHYGTASSFYGSDAIGGSVVVGQSGKVFKKTFKGSVNQQIGSFGRMSTGVKLSYGSDRWQFRSKVYRSFIKNDFTFNSPAVGYKKTQRHAAVLNYGFDQEVHYKISDRQTMSGEIMYVYNDREVQSAVTNDQGDEVLQNRNLRMALNYTNDSRLGIIHATAAYQFSDQDYFDDETANVQSTQATAQINVDKSINRRGALRYGISLNHYTASAENFDHPREERYDAFVSYRYSILENWIVNINARQSLYDQRYAPLSPTLGTEVHVWNTQTDKISLRAQLARGFRVPTLDDRYWNPGGNPLTKPEDALHAETGIRWKRTSDHTLLTIDATAFQSWIDRMIVWLPDDDGIWSPFNLQKVEIKGAEFSSQIEKTTHRIKIKTRVDYSYTQSLNKNGLPPTDPSFVDKQLPYVPIHNTRVSVKLYNETAWVLGLNYGYTGLRFSTLDNTSNQSLEAYHMTDVSVSKKQNFPKWSFQATAEIRNVFDVYYENLKNRAMPGRNYSVNFLINF